MAPYLAIDAKMKSERRAWGDGQASARTTAQPSTAAPPENAREAAPGPIQDN